MSPSSDPEAVEPSPLASPTQQALEALRQGDSAGAEALLLAALEKDPGDGEALMALSAVLGDRGELMGAIACLGSVVELQPQNATAFDRLAQMLLQQGELEGARWAYGQLSELQPRMPDAHHNLGVVLRQLGDLPAALASCERAVQLAPDDPELLCNLGVVQAELGDREAAVRTYRRALALRSAYPEVLSNLGSVLWDLDDLPAAMDCCRQLLQLNPQDGEALNHLGILHWDQGDPAAALACFDQALALGADQAEVRRNRGLLLLLLDQAREGWCGYEERLRCRDAALALPRKPASPPWQGTNLEPASPGDPLLLVAEQGLGDALQFMRYVPHLRQRGWDARLCAPASLHGLIRVSGIDAAPMAPEQLEQWDTGDWLPLLSVPQKLGVSRSQPLHGAPYLQGDDERLARWRERLRDAPRPLIGINWQGNPNPEIGQFRGRSLPLETFAPLAQACGGSLLALQKGHGSEQLDTCSFRDRFVACQEQVSASWDFLEMAAIIACCDLVISSDTAVAHLAGGLGHPTWLLLKQVPDWRWGLEGDHSPWYPSMRLFRQRRRGDWDGVIARVVAALAAEEGLQGASRHPAP